MYVCILFLSLAFVRIADKRDDLLKSEYIIHIYTYLRVFTKFEISRYVNINRIILSLWYYIRVAYNIILQCVTFLATEYENVPRYRAVNAVDRGYIIIWCLPNDAILPFVRVCYGKSRKRYAVGGDDCAYCCYSAVNITRDYKTRVNIIILRYACAMLLSRQRRHCLAKRLVKVYNIDWRLYFEFQFVECKNPLVRHARTEARYPHSTLQQPPDLRNMHIRFDFFVLRTSCHVQKPKSLPLNSLSCLSCSAIETIETFQNSSKTQSIRG